MITEHDERWLNGVIKVFKGRKAVLSSTTYFEMSDVDAAVFLLNRPVLFKLKHNRAIQVCYKSCAPKGARAAATAAKIEDDPRLKKYAEANTVPRLIRSVDSTEGQNAN